MKIVKQYSGNEFTALKKAEDSHFFVAKTDYYGIFDDVETKDVLLIVYPNKKTERLHRIKKTELYFTELEARKLLAQLNELINHN